MPANNTEIEKRLWDAADELRANSKLKSSEYSVPVLGLIFLRYADPSSRRPSGNGAEHASGPRRRTIGKIDYQARGVLYLPEAARFSRPADAARGRQHRQGDQRRDEGHRGGERRPEGRAAQDLQPAGQRDAGRPAEELQLDPDGHRGRRLRQDLRVLPGQVRHDRGPEGRRVLHPHLHRQADRRDHRAVPRPHLRPGLRLGRHVRAERPLRVEHRHGANGASDRRPHSASTARRRWPRRCACAR